MKDAIRWLTLLIIIAATGSGLFYQYQNTRPCTNPIPYAIGTVDSRFGIANSTLIKDAESAVSIWNKAEGKTVFVYDKNAGLKINLIYDEREVTAKLGSAISRQQADTDLERAALDAVQAQYTLEQTAYNQKVDAVNVRGGGTRSEVSALNAERDSLNALADSINSRVASYNASVRALNAVVAEYNKTAGHTFEQGQYVRDSAGERINIFEFVGNLQLERVLAHEFGHALGLGHNDDPKSIMYAKNESGNLVPTASDLSALRALCGA